MADPSQARILPPGDRPAEELSNPVLENIYGRRSIRNYKPDPVPDDVLLEIIKAGIYAPTARNQQLWRFAVVTDKAVIDRYSDRAKRLWLKHIGLRAAAILGIGGPGLSKVVRTMKTPDMHLFHHAPALVLIFAPNALMVELDCAGAAQNMLLAARSLGVGSCWVGFAKPLGTDKKTLAELKVPKGYRLVAAMVFGYPANEARKAPARKTDVLISWDGY